MKYGLYEKVVDKNIRNKIRNENHSKIRIVDKSEMPKVISTAYEKLIYESILSLKTDGERMEFIDQINRSIGLEGFDIEKEKCKELLLVHNDEDKFKELNQFRPRTSIANSSLFTGNSDLTLESELRREIRTADEIDFLISFIKYSGLRLIYDDLVEFTKKNKLRVITTSYMGASDYKAILELSKLPNTEVKISYDTKRTRLHAKAYHFKRDTGFSTAYIGSSNLSNPALSNGLEWNLKVSEYTSKDVVNSLSKTFESYWNDDEFVKFEPKDEENRRELKRSLSLKSRDDRSYIFFDLRPYFHQKEILEDLKVEREEYNSYKNLVVAATGVGKTYIAAFDLKAYDKILFVAHREGILLQAEQTFKNVRSDIKTGFFMGTKKDLNVDVLFATVQTIGQDRYLKDKYSNKRALAFCASRSHAVYMAQYFCGHGVAACPVVSGKHSEYCMDRREAISKLNRCDIDIIFAVDIFNEGVDIPALDLIMFLWPTESSTVILQQ